MAIQPLLESLWFQSVVTVERKSASGSLKPGLRLASYISNRTWQSLKLQCSLSNPHQTHRNNKLSSSLVKYIMKQIFKSLKKHIIWRTTAMRVITVAGLSPLNSLWGFSYKVLCYNPGSNQSPCINSTLQGNTYYVCQGSSDKPSNIHVI